MNLGLIWDWEKLKLSSDIDFSEKSVGFSDVPIEKEEEEEDLPPAIKAERRKAMHADTKEIHESSAMRNLNKMHLIPVTKLPYRRRLDVKLDSLKVPSASLDSLKHFDESSFRPRKQRVRKLQALKNRASVSDLQQESADEQQTVVVEEKHGFQEKPYQGDLFGTRGDYIKGMVYRSRMEKNVIRSNVLGSSPTKKVLSMNSLGAQDEGQAAKVQAEETAAVAASVSTVPREQSEQVQGEQNDAKRRCAATLRNWSFHKENRTRMVKEGAIEALIQLAVVDDLKTKEYVATAFQQLASEASLRLKIIGTPNSIRTITELCTNDSASISRDCAAVFCHLSCAEGVEHILVETGVVMHLMIIMQEHKEVVNVCCRALFNLSCVTEPYDLIQKVIKVIISLGSAPSSSMETKKICVSALCNMSNIPRIHAKVVDEGGVQLLGTLARECENTTKLLISIVLNNLCSGRSIRSELVKKGMVQVLIQLADTNDLERQHWCAAALYKLIQDRGSRVRIVEEGAVSALSTIAKSADKGKYAQTMQLCAWALLNLATFEGSKQLIVDQGAVPVLIALAKSSDAETKQACTLALCSLLSLKESAIGIMQQGAVAALVQLSNTDKEDTRAACAAVLFNLSCSRETGALVVAEGFVPAILALSKAKLPKTRLRCAATLCNLASIEENSKRMVDERVVPCLVNLMTTANTGGDLECVRHCTVALCNLSHDQKNAGEIVKDINVMKAIASGDFQEVVAQRCICTVMANLTRLREGRSSLAELGAIASLLELSKLDDDATRHRCAVAFCNLSCEPSIREKMVEEGVVPILADLSNSYSEENQQDCAKAICNLSAHIGAETRIVDAGTMPAIMMIAMVRAVSAETKQICAKALLNLITDDSLSTMVQQGLAQALANMAKLEGDETMMNIAKAYCLLTASEDKFSMPETNTEVTSRQVMCAKQPQITPLLKIVSRTNETAVMIMAGKAVCNLLMHEDSRVSTVNAGAVKVLKQLATVDSVGNVATMFTADATFMLSCCPVSRASLLEEDALPVLFELAKIDSWQSELSIARAITHLAWHEQTRVHLTQAGVMKAITTLITPEGVQENVLVAVARAICYLSLHDDQQNLCQMVEEGAGHALSEIHRKLLQFGDKDIDKPFVKMLIAHALRGLSQAQGEGCMKTMVDEGVVLLLCELAKDEQIAGESAVESMIIDCATAFVNIAYVPKLRKTMLAQEAHVALTSIAVPDTAAGNHRAACALRFMAIEPANWEAMVSAQVAATLVALADRPGASDETQRDCAAAMCSLSECESPDVRADMLKQGSLPTLIRMSKMSDAETVKSCSIALSNLSTASATVDEGTVGALISMSLGSADTPLPDFVTNVDRDDKPPALRLTGLKPPSTETMQEICVVHNVKDMVEKQIAGAAGNGPPKEQFELMQTQKLPQISGGGSDDDFFLEKVFPKMELTIEMAEDLQAAAQAHAPPSSSS